MAECNRQGGERCNTETFFKRSGARYKRIRKRPRGEPSPQLYAYKKEKLQGFEELDSKGDIILYYIMPMRDMYVPMATFHMDGNTKTRMSMCPQKKRQG